MDFSLFHLPTYRAGFSASLNAFYEELSAATRLADRLGWARVMSSEHHFHYYGGAVPNPAVALAGWARETTRIRLAAAAVRPCHIRQFWRGEFTAIEPWPRTGERVAAWRFGHRTGGYHLLMNQYPMSFDSLAMKLRRFQEAHPPGGPSKEVSVLGCRGGGSKERWKRCWEHAGLGPRRSDVSCRVRRHACDVFRAPTSTSASSWLRSVPGPRG